MDTKKCSRCSTVKPVSRFKLINRVHGVAQRGSLCCTCYSRIRRFRSGQTLNLVPKKSDGHCPIFQRCKRCEQIKPIFSFKLMVRGHKRTCMECVVEHQREYNRQYAATEKGKAARERSVVRLVESGWMYQHGVRKHMLKQYGLSEFEYKKLLWKQDGKCAICLTEPSPYAKHRRGLHIDHDHETGAVRGLLCGNCNAALGHFKDNVESLASAVQYLVRSKARQETKRESETG